MGRYNMLDDGADPLVLTYQKHFFTGGARVGLLKFMY